MTNQKILFLVLGTFILAGMGFFIYRSPNYSALDTSGNPVQNPVPNPSPIPNPSPSPINKTGSGYVAGHVTIGPFCPVERLDMPCKGSPEAYTSREAVVYAINDSTVVARAHLDAQGNYKIALSPGSYFVQISPAGIGAGEKKQITINSGVTSVVDFDIDTGIR